MFRAIICLVVVAFLTTIHGLNFTGSDVARSNGSSVRLQRSESTNHCFFTAGLTYVKDEPRSRVDCFFNENQACYAFVDARNRSEVKYGCGKVDVKELPKRCADQSNKVHCEDDYFDFGKFGKVCCCKGANCNSYDKLMGEIVPKPEPTSTTTTTTEVALTTSEDDEAIGLSVMGLIVVASILLVVVIVMCGCHCYTLSKVHNMEQEFDVRSRKLKEHLDQRDAALMAQYNSTMAENVRKQVTRLWNMCSANAVKLSAALDSQAERNKTYEAPSSIGVDRSSASSNAAGGASKSSKACWPCQPHSNKPDKYADIPLTPAHLYPPHTDQPVQSKHVSKPAEFRSLHPTASNESIPTTRPHQ